MKNGFTCSGSSPQILTPGEVRLLRAIWNSPQQAATVREVHALNSPLALTTVLTVMVRLKRKKVLKRMKVGREYVYRSLVTREQAFERVRILYGVQR